jgi:anti-sigma regulatory factor (Ser/Thr protein kinase)
MNARGGNPLHVKFCLAFQREALSVPVTRRMLGDVLRTVGVDDDSISDILLAATEACSNVLMHGGPRATGYAVAVTIGGDRCEVEVAEESGFAGTGPAAGFPRRAAGSGDRLSRPSPGLTMPGGRRRARRLVPRAGAGRMPWRRAGPATPSGPASPASGPAQGRGEARRPGRAPDVMSLPESGRGLEVMRACVDDVTLRSHPGRGTVVTMGKRIRWSGDAPLARMRAAR